MAFEHPGGGALDYKMCRYGTSRLLVRGPKVRLAPPYTVFMGGTETFGRFVPRPFATFLGDTLGLTSVNLGCVNAGLDAVAGDPALLDVLRRAEQVVIQIVGAQNLSNRFYSVHPRRNDRFIAASEALTRLYPELDFTDFSFTRHLLGALERHGADRFALVVDELKTRWREQMERLLDAAGPGAVLLWLSETRPPQEAETLRGGRDPLFVDLTMLVPLAAGSHRLVEVIPSAAARGAGTRGMIFSEFERHIAERTFGPAVHVEIAEALAPALRGKSAAA